MAGTIKNMNKRYVERGDIYYIRSTGFECGSEQRKTRPAIVVSNNKNNRASTCIEVIYLTTKEKKDLPTHVKITSNTPGTALCESVNTVDISRFINYVGKCTDEEMRMVDKALAIGLELKINENIRYINLNVTSFEPGNNPVLIDAAQIIQEINEFGLKINKIERMLNDEKSCDYINLEKILSPDRIAEIKLLTMKKIDDEKKFVEKELASIVDLIKRRNDIKCGAEYEVVKKVGRKPLSKVLPKEIRDKIHELIELGYSNMEIAEMTGVSNKQAGDYRYRHNKKKEM